jgi:hypothetical protein
MQIGRINLLLWNPSTQSAAGGAPVFLTRPALLLPEHLQPDVSHRGGSTVLAPTMLAPAAGAPVFLTRLGLLGLAEGNSVAVGKWRATRARATTWIRREIIDDRRRELGDPSQSRPPRLFATIPHLHRQDLTPLDVGGAAPPHCCCTEVRLEAWRRGYGHKCLRYELEVMGWEIGSAPQVPVYRMCWCLGLIWPLQRSNCEGTYHTHLNPCWLRQPEVHAGGLKGHLRHAEGGHCPRSPPACHGWTTAHLPYRSYLCFLPPIPISQFSLVNCTMQVHLNLCCANYKQFQFCREAWVATRA